MRRVVARVSLPGTIGGGARAWVEASDSDAWDNSRRVCAPVDIGLAGGTWHEDGFAFGVWLGAVPPQGALDEEWLTAGHLESTWRIQAVSWPMHFGRVYLRGVLAEHSGRRQILATRELLLNDSPGPVCGLRLVGREAAGDVGVGISPSP